MLRDNAPDISLEMVFSAAIVAALAHSSGSLPGSALQPSSSIQPSKSERRVIMEPDVPVGSRHGWFEGSSCSNSDMIHNLTFMLRHNQTQMDAMHDALMKISDPLSDDYGKRLTADDVAEMTRIPSGISAVQDFLRRMGIPLAWTRVSRFGDSIEVSMMPCWKAERAFSTTIKKFSHPDQGTLLRVASKYSLPHEVAQHVAIIAPLIRLPPPNGKKRLAHQIRRAAPVSPTPHSRLYASGNTTDEDADTLTPITQNVNLAFLGESWPSDCGHTCRGSYETSRYVTPAVLKRQYGIYDDDWGSGESSRPRGSMAIAAFQGQVYVQDGLDEYAASCGLPPIHVSHHVGGDAPRMCLAGSCDETMMDLELLGAMGGRVPITLVYNQEYSLERWALQIGEMDDEHIPLVNSISYGDDEIMQSVEAPIGQSGTAYMERINGEFMKLGLRGVSILVAAGDQGVWGRSGVLSGEHFHADFPASSPYVTAVGGTDLKVKSVFGDEQAWAEGGGGFSHTARMPEYQRAAVEAYLDANSTWGHLAGTQGRFDATKRAYPDLAALGGVQNAYCIIGGASGAWLGIGGTSASSPAVAGMVARLNERRLQADKSPLGFLNPFLYANPDAFRDVQVGENKADGFIGFRATAGWDAATGLGTPRYDRLVEAAMKLP